MLHKETRDWILESTYPLGRIVFVKEIFGGATAFIHSVTVADGDGRLNRFIVKTQRHSGEWWEEIFRNEAEAVLVANRNGIASPRLVSHNKKAPAVLMTKVFGRVHLAPVPRKWTRRIAETLKAIHDVAPSSATRVKRYQTTHRHHTEEKIPTWSRDRSTWRELIRIANCEKPPSIFRFCHGDYHPGNIMWKGEALSGVIDWQFAVVGPPQRDIAHCRANLGLLQSADAADGFYKTYLETGGDTWPAQRIYDARGILTFAPDPEKVWDWRGFGRPDLTRNVLRRNLEEYVQSLVSARVD